MSENTAVELTNKENDTTKVKPDLKI